MIHRGERRLYIIGSNGMALCIRHAKEWIARGHTVYTAESQPAEPCAICSRQKRNRRPKPTEGGRHPEVDAAISCRLTLPSEVLAQRRPPEARLVG
jgi:hypothetical protein